MNRQISESTLILDDASDVDDDPTSVFCPVAAEQRGSIPSKTDTTRPSSRLLTLTKNKPASRATMPPYRSIRAAKSSSPAEGAELAFEPTVRQPLPTSTVIDVRWEDLDTSLDMRLSKVTRPLPFEPGKLPGSQVTPPYLRTRSKGGTAIVTPPPKPTVVIAPSAIVSVGNGGLNATLVSGECKTDSAPRGGRLVPAKQDCAPPPPPDRHLTSIFSHGAGDTAWEIPSLEVPMLREPRVVVAAAALETLRATRTQIHQRPAPHSLAKTLCQRALRVALLSMTLFGTCIVVLRGVDALDSSASGVASAHAIQMKARAWQESSRTVWERVVGGARVQQKSGR